MKAIQYYGPKNIKLEEVPVKPPEKGEVVVKIMAALTCGTDVKTYRRGHPVLIKKIPSGFGHEFSGIVENVGAGVENVKVGDRVVAANSAPCGECFYCKKGEYNLCENLDLLNGAYAQYITVPARIVEKNMLILPDDLSFERAAFCEPLANVVHGAYRTGIKEGDSVGIIGIGPIGLMFARIAKLMGARVIVAGRNPMKLNAAEEFAHADEIIFTGCATESDNTAIFSAVRSFPNKKHIITSAVEHPAILHPLRYLEGQGYKVDYIGVDAQGRFNMDQYKAALRDDTALVTVMWANNETGTVFPVREIAELAHARGALFHTDAVQVIGKLPIDIKETHIDMLSLSGHKFNAPKGVGALYVRRGTRFTEFMMGGHQEKARRGGTENIPYIVGLGKAAELAKERAFSIKIFQIGELRNRLQKGLLETIPDRKLNGDPNCRVPNTLNISFGYVEGEAILMHLNEYGICASSGSACTSGSLEPSHVMRAMGVDFQFAHGSVRFSLSEDTTQEEIDKVLEVMPGIIENLRKISPFSRLKK